MQAVASEGLVRLAVFVSVFAAMAVFELWSPRLERAEFTGALKGRRWFTNLSMVVLSSVLLRIVFPAAAVGVALVAERNGWGLLRMAGMDPLWAGVVSFVVLDFSIWLEHLAFHKIGILWRIHRVHHADTGVDVTTALRFHPLEILISMLWKSAIVLTLGAPVTAVLVFEIVLNACAMFNHANLKLPLAVDRLLRLALVTPDMHRVHHSLIRREADSNYGFNFPFWDRLFGTYRAQPAHGHDGMGIGVDGIESRQSSQLGWSLRYPFNRS